MYTFSWSIEYEKDLYLIGVDKLLKFIILYKFLRFLIEC